jgi:endonuclease V-like protein UPF0215 family
MKADAVESKKGIRILAVASGPIEKRKRALVIGVVERERIVEGILSCSVEVDGDDATRSMEDMLRSSKFRELVKIIALDGAALAGLNIVNVEELGKRLGVHLMLITRHKPGKGRLERAIKKFGKANGLDVSQKLVACGNLKSLDIFHEEGIYIMTDLEESSTRRLAPTAFEALRLAHLIARGIATGESKGRI